ncbi:MAG: CDP-alcohol phosphatidyltransferase family protein [Pseudomonadota bacterium]
MTISIYLLKPKFQQLLRPVLDALARRRVTPNQVTLGTLSLSLAYGAALAWRPDFTLLWLGLPFFLLARMALNALDGMLAQATGQKTALGALLNEMCDQVADVALYLPFMLLGTLSAPLVLLSVILALLAEFAGVLALAVGVARRFDGPMGKSDRAFYFGLLALCSWGGAAAPWMNGMLLVIMGLSACTAFNRLRQALRLCAPEKR